MTVNLLWTGGWDSTFRVIQILRETEASIQPHYVIDRERPSNTVELQTIESLTDLINRQIPNTKHRLKPLIVANRDDIPPSSEITAALRTLREQGHIGGQYEWLARYASQHVQNPLELSMEDAEHRSYAAQLIHGNLIQCEGLSRYKIKEDAGLVTTLFGPFRFPIIKYDKVAMRDQAEQWRLANILYETWFCHYPVLNKYACGTCRPCVHVMDNGQTWRMGAPGRIRYKLIEQTRRNVPAPVKHWLRARAGRRIRRWFRA